MNDKRALSPEEEAVIEADQARERDERTDRLATLEAARRRYFELLAADAGEEEE